MSLIVIVMSLMVIVMSLRVIVMSLIVKVSIRAWTISVDCHCYFWCALKNFPPKVKMSAS
jgi:hypothetical protein